MSPPASLPLPAMAWSLYLTTGASSAVSDAQLAELDEFELVSRGPVQQAHAHLRQRIAHIIHALVCAAGAMPGRQHMLRSVTTLQSVLDVAAADAALLRLAVRGLSALHMEYVQKDGGGDNVMFLRPLVDIAVNRVSDKQLSGSASLCLAVLLGCPSLDRGNDDQVADEVCVEAEEQTRRLVRLLITEIVLTASPTALKALSWLLRRDFARVAFCDKDGVSTLASTLLTHPTKRYTAFGEILASSGVGVNHTPVAAAYHAVFAVWMLSFAVAQEVLEQVLTCVLSSRLLVVLTRLLNHASGQRLKIARVTLSSLRNLAEGNSELHTHVRRDLIAAEVPAVLQRLQRMGSGPGALLGTDEDALADSHALIDLLRKERDTMSNLDTYVSEVRAGALHWSPVHSDESFWTHYSQRLVDEHRDIVLMLAEVIVKAASSLEICVACSDLYHICRESSSGKAVLLRVEGLKTGLMKLMTMHEDDEVQKASLRCVQLLITSGSRRLTH